MAEPLSRREPSVKLIKVISLIVSLMFLIHNVKSLTFENNLELYKETFQAMLKQAVGYQKQRPYRLENISRLLKEAKSITNKEQLERFMENLEEAVDEAFEKKIKNRIAAALKRFNLVLHRLSSILQQRKMDPTNNLVESQMLHATEQVIESTRTYLTLKTKVLAVEANDVGEKLKEVLNVLKKSQQERHEEL